MIPYAKIITNEISILYGKKTLGMYFIFPLYVPYLVTNTMRVWKYNLEFYISKSLVFPIQNCTRFDSLQTNCFVDRVSSHNWQQNET